MSRDEILNILQNYKVKNHKKYGILKIGVFGSVAKNISTADSDIDIVIEQEKPDLYALVHIKEELESEFQKKIDLIRIRKNMNEFLKNRIQSEAVYV